MDKHALQVLEYNKAIIILRRYLVTEIGERYLDSLSPSNNLELIMLRQRMISEIRSLLDWGHSIPLSPLKDLTEAISKATVSGVILDASTLLGIWHLARVSRLLKAFFHKHRADAATTWRKVSEIGDVGGLEAHIEKAIDEDTNIKDSASPQLKRIRNEKSRLSSRITSVLNDILSSSSSASHLQDRVITIRNGRYVIPVRAEARSKIEGIVHDTSQSGATVFVEPMRTVELNNALRTLELQEKDEIVRILTSLTSEVREHSKQLISNLKIIGEVDMLTAAAVFAKEFGCSQVTITSERRLKLVGACHPILLEMKRSGQIDSVVPLDLELNHKGMLITGPNAGGKTVALKTIGLIVLLAQTGLPVPCKDGTEIGLFENVYADIGDEQSIELSLSTFSSHMQNIKRILQNADQASLVLLDEIGAGTDPREGAALARTTVEELLEKGATVIATTHHGDLKVFAHEDPNLENASMEFDPQTLSPTYRLIQGIPGASHAFEIAEQLGFPQNLLKRAKDYVGTERTRFEELTQELIAKIQTVTREKATIEAKQREIEHLIGEYESRLEALRAEQKQIRHKALKEARNVVEDARRTVSRLLKELKERQPAPHEARRIEKRIREQSLELAKEIDAITESPALKRLEEIRPGVKAYIRPLGADGTIMAEPDTNGRVVVVVGNLRVEVEAKDLFEPQSKEPAAGRATFEFEMKSVPSEIDVRGMTAEDAWEKVDRYLDDAMLYGYDWVRVIHGKGRGILARKIHEMLTTHPAVRSHRFGEITEGGTGVTIVELRKA